MTAPWTPAPGDQVEVPAPGARGTETRTWWHATVRTVTPPYVAVLVQRPRVRRLVYRLDQIRRRG